MRYSFTGGPSSKGADFGGSKGGQILLGTGGGGIETVFSNKFKNETAGPGA